MLQGAANDPNVERAHARALLASSTPVLLHLLTGGGAPADAVLHQLCSMAVPTAARNGGVLDSSGRVDQLSRDVAFVLAGALPCLCGKAAADAYRVADAADTVMNMAAHSDVPDVELTTSLLHRLLGVLVEDTARQWPASAVQSALHTVRRAVRASLRLDSWVLGCVALLVHIQPAEHAGHLLDVIDAALDGSGHHDGFDVFAVLVYPVAKLADDLERSGDEHSKQVRPF